MKTNPFIIGTLLTLLPLIIISACAPIPTLSHEDQKLENDFETMVAAAETAQDLSKHTPTPTTEPFRFFEGEVYVFLSKPIEGLWKGWSFSDDPLSDTDELEPICEIHPFEGNPNLWFGFCIGPTVPIFGAESIQAIWFKDGNWVNEQIAPPPQTEP